MRCQDVSPLLDDLVDDALADAQRIAVERHVSECLTCRSELADLRALRDATRALPERIEPPHDLWRGIGDALDRRVVQRLDPDGRWIRVRRSVLAAAAAALIIGSAGVTATVLRSGDGAGTTTGALPDDLAVVETRYLAAARDLEAALAARRGELGPAAIRVIDQSLGAIDRAIAEAREAVAEAPDAPDLAHILWAEHRMKIDLLQRASRL